MSEEPQWKRLKLSLERPYKDDDGKPIPELLDITPEGQHIYEPEKNLTTKIGENLRRIFLERGHSFFEKSVDERKYQAEPSTQEHEDAEDTERNKNMKVMTPEELFKLRMEMLPQLHIALGEMSQARDLLSLLLAASGDSQPSAVPSLSQTFSQPTSSQPQPPGLPPSSLAAVIVTKQPPIQSVHTFHMQLAISGKDKALRQAANLFKNAAQGMEKGRLRSEKYWVDALKMRRGNWGLIPAPLPPGSATGKGADRTSKDFRVSFGLEESSFLFKRRAIGRMSTLDNDIIKLEFPLRQYTRLQVSLIYTDSGGSRHHGRNHHTVIEEKSVEQALLAAQAEVVEQEIFSVLIREASNLPTASARVSERLIVIEAAQSIELRFELVDSDNIPQDSSLSSDELQASCDLIYSCLRLLVLRSHAHNKSQRLGQTSSIRSSQSVSSPPTLQPIIDILQYQVFCRRIHSEMHRIIQGLRDAGVSTKLYFTAVGESSDELISQLQLGGHIRLSGECMLRIDNRRSLRFTFSSPSSLTVHLPQATLLITSIPQLSQLLVDEVDGCILQRICDVGLALCEHAHGIWFVDTLCDRTVGRWEGHVLTFSVSFTEDGSILCAASCLERGERHPMSHIETYSSSNPQSIPLLQWVQQTVEAVLLKS